MRAGVWWMMAAVAVLGACAGSDAGASSGTAVAPDVSDPAGSTAAPATVTAPATTTPPVLPPPCDAANLAVWTAQVLVDAAAGTAVPVLRVRNDGGAWCEADISRSAIRSDEVEPNVWLDPGAWADLVTTESATDCQGGPVAVTVIDLVMNDVALAVPTAAVTRCGLALAAYFPNEGASRDCTPDDVRLQASGSGSWFAVTNTSGVVCRLGASLTPGEPGPAPSVPIDVLAPGDVVAWRYADPIDGCSESSTTVQFEAFTFETDQVPPCVVPLAGPSRPYHGSPETPFVLAAGSGSDAAVTLIDPFADW